MYHKQIELLEVIDRTESDHDRFNAVKQIIEQGGFSDEDIASIINWNKGEIIFNLIEKCDITTLNYFIEKGADVKVKNQEGFTALHWACIRGKDRVVKLLLEKKDKNGNYIVNVNEKDGAGFTALLLACFLKHDNIIKLLLDTGRVNLKKDVIKNVNDPMINNIFSAYLSNSVIEAAKINWLNRVNYLISNKDNTLINEKDKYGNTPLHYACMNKNFKIVKLLLEKKDKNGNCIANVNEKNKEGYSPLHYACIIGDNKLVKLLLEKKNRNGNYIANVNEKDVIGSTVLHYACLLEHDELLKLLIEMKDKNGNCIANINEKNKVGYTPLHIACLKRELQNSKAPS